MSVTLCGKCLTPEATCGCNGTWTHSTDTPRVTGNIVETPFRFPDSGNVTVVGKLTPAGVEWAEQIFDRFSAYPKDLD